MPLTRAKKEFLTAEDGVEFLMCDGEKEVLCWAGPELLRNRFESKNSAEDSVIFQTNRTAIEQAVSDKYDAASLDQLSHVRLIVTADDMASSISKKM